MSTHYDVIVIGTGAGGGTLARHLAEAGKRVLILERGPFLPREKANWNTDSVFIENRYHTKEVWSDKDGKPLHPQTGYWVGGNTKVYGAAMFRLRPRDFEVLQHQGGISPEWIVKYDEFEPYYVKAEHLYSVRGQGGIDPTEGHRSKEYPFPALSNEPRMQQLEDEIRSLGFKPFPTPLGLKRDEANPVESACIRCDTCDGFPCLVDAKADADLDGVRPVRHRENVTLLTSARVLRIHTGASGRDVSSVEVRLQDSETTTHFTGDIVAVCCGAINSAALLLASANDRHPNGLANSSGQVGRNFMFHQAGAILAITRTPNPTHYMKTFALNDFYFGEKDYEFPMGNIQPVGSFQYQMMEGDAPPLTPDFVLKKMTSHAVPWWLTTEDLPSQDNRVRWVDGAVRLEYTPNNTVSFGRLMSRWTEILRKVDGIEHVMDFHAFFKKRIPLEAVGHQNGTCRFGPDPATSVLDRNCRAHDVDNLYIVDGSFFPSSGAVNPSLTIIANAIRIGDHLLERLK